MYSDDAERRKPVARKWDEERIPTFARRRPDVSVDRQAFSNSVTDRQLSSPEKRGLSASRSYARYSIE